jgi:hypothetical protein
MSSNASLSSRAIGVAEASVLWRHPAGPRRFAGAVGRVAFETCGTVGVRIAGTARRVVGRRAYRSTILRIDAPLVAPPGSRNHVCGALAEWSRGVAADRKALAVGFVTVGAASEASTTARDCTPARPRILEHRMTVDSRLALLLGRYVATRAARATWTTHCAQSALYGATRAPHLSRRAGSRSATHTCGSSGSGAAGARSAISALRTPASFTTQS